MAHPIEGFGRIGTAPVERVKLTGGGLTAHILTWGAVLQDVRLDGHEPSLVLGLDTLDDYLEHSPNYGAIVGRVANRIAKGRFPFDGRTIQLDTNTDDGNTLHGGSEGTGRRIWQIDDLGTSHVALKLVDPDGAMGFPGDCVHYCTYTLKQHGVLQIVLATKAASSTVAALAPHPYFTLDGGGDCRDLTLRIDADRYLPLGEDLLPTGEIASVDGTDFDFREPTTIGSRREGEYDRNFCLAEERRSHTREVAWIQRADGALAMTVATTAPGLQVYTGSKAAVPVPGLDGVSYDAFCGLALEPQNWPNAVNHDHFPTARLEAGYTRRQVSEFRFEKR